MNTAEKSLIGLGAALVGALFLCNVADSLARSAPPSAASSYDVPYSVSADLPYTASVKDAVGRTITVSGTKHVAVSGVDHIEIAEPAPVPVPTGITFGAVTDSFGAALTQASAGKLLKLKGSGFPTGAPNSFLRLSLAGQSMGVSAWTATSIEWFIPNSVTDPLSSPLTGKFQVWRQVNGQWSLLGEGGQFTLLPSPRVGAPRR